MDTDYKSSNFATADHFSNSNPSASSSSSEDSIDINDLTMSDLTMSILSDVYYSLTGWDVSEIIKKDKKSMNNAQFHQFFTKYIYSSISIQSSKNEKIFEANKHAIVNKLFSHICSENNLKNSKIPFQHFVIFQTKLNKNDFISIVTKVETEYKMDKNQNRALPAIDEHISLDGNEELNEQNLIIRLRRVKKKLRDIERLSKKVPKGTVDSNQQKKIDKKTIFENQKTEIERLLTEMKEKRKCAMRLDGTGKFVYQFYEAQCFKQWNRYKGQCDVMRVKMQKYNQKYQELQKKNEKLMKDNLECKNENLLLKKRLSELQRQNDVLSRQ